MHRTESFALHGGSQRNPVDRYRVGTISTATDNASSQDSTRL